MHLREMLAQGATDSVTLRLLGLLEDAQRHAAPVLAFSSAAPLEEAALRAEMDGLWLELVPARAGATGPLATRFRAVAATRAAFPEPHGRKAAQASQAAILS